MSNPDEDLKMAQKQVALNNLKNYAKEKYGADKQARGSLTLPKPIHDRLMKLAKELDVTKVQMVELLLDAAEGKVK